MSVKNCSWMNAIGLVQENQNLNTWNAISYFSLATNIMQEGTYF